MQLHSNFQLQCLLQFCPQNLKIMINPFTRLLCSGVATGGQAGQLAPQPPIGHPVRSMQIRGDFRVRKNGGRFTGFAPTFYMHRRYGRRSLVLQLRKKRELWKLLKELLW